MVASAGCEQPGEFQCASSSQCQSAGVDGTCEASGFCSFPDAGCESGRRYGGLAGPLSNVCVADTPADEGGTSEQPCLDASEGCECASGETCEPGLTCIENRCVAGDCVLGTMGCACLDGACFEGLQCIEEGLCAPAEADDDSTGGADDAASTGVQSCRPALDGDDCNRNDILDTCEPKADGGTCILEGFVQDVADVEVGSLTRDIKMAYVHEQGPELLLGMEFHEPLVFDGSSAVYELWWYFDADQDPTTGSVQTPGFGGERHIRAEILANGSSVVRVDDQAVFGVVVMSESGSFLLVRLRTPEGLFDDDGAFWLSASGGWGGNFYGGTDKTPIGVLGLPQPIAEDCDDDGWFDACEPDLVDELGLGLGFGDGVPDRCQADADHDGIDDSCGDFFG